MKKLFKPVKGLNRRYVIFITVFLVTILGFVIFNKSTEPEEIKYVEFLEMVEKDEVKEIDLRNDDDQMYFTSEEDEIYITDNPKTEQFKEDMLKKGIKVENELPTMLFVIVLFSYLSEFLLVALIIFVIIYFAKSMNKSKFEIKSNSVNIKFSDIAGNQEAKSDMEFLVKFLKDPTKYNEIGASLPNGVIFHGPPGTGKTLMAKAIAGEANVPFYYISGSDFIEMFAGLGAKRVRDLFAKAKQNSPCIIFIDEIDAIGGKRGANKQNAENDQTINALLEQLDGFNSDDKIIVIAATNRLDGLDNALIRPGRFDRHINIGLPDVKDRKAILEIYAKTKKVSKNIDFNSLAHITIGFSGASIEALMNEAAIIAVNRGSKEITEEDIDEAYFKVAMKGNKKKNRNSDEKEIELVAYHEAGHALVTKLLTDNHLHKVTIIPSTSGAGGATFSVPKKMSLISKKEILNNVMVLYAGRAAEEILKGNKEDITSGASMDIKQSTEYIKSYFCELGMSEKLGMLAIDNEDLYMEEAIKLSKELYEKTLILIKENRVHLDKIAQALLKNETITGQDVDDLMQ